MRCYCIPFAFFRLRSRTRGFRQGARSSSGALLLTHAQWQGEGGLNAKSLIHGASVGSQVLAELLPASTQHRTVPPTSTPMPKPWRLPERAVAPGVNFQKDLVDQTAATLQILDAVSPSKIFTAGGDSSADLAPCGWLQERYRGDLAVLHVDAHADLNNSVESSSGNFHGMSLRALLGDAPEGLSPRQSVSPKALVFAGLREPGDSEAREIERLGLVCLPPDALRDDAGVAALRQSLRATACSKLHIHLDLDVLDPTVFRHSTSFYKGCSGAKGLEIQELQQLLAEAADELHLVGLTISELRPRFCCMKKNGERAPCCSKARAWTQTDEEYCLHVVRNLLGPSGLDVASQAKTTI